MSVELVEEEGKDEEGPGVGEVHGEAVQHVVEQPGRGAGHRLLHLDMVGDRLHGDLVIYHNMIIEIVMKQM